MESRSRKGQFCLVALAFSLLPLAFASTVILRGPASSLFGVPPASGGGGGGASYTNPFAYYRLDETGGSLNTFIDVAGGGFNLTSGTAATSVSGQITNAYSIDNGAIDFTSSNTNFNFGDGDFAIRFWIQPVQVNNNSVFLEAESDDLDGGILIMHQISPENGILFGIDDTGFGFTDITSSHSIPTNEWHRVFVWRTSTNIGIKIDDNTSETTSFSGVTVGAWGNWHWQWSTHINNYDEIALWKGYVPTESEMTTDWNSGAGLTYPLQ